MGRRKHLPILLLFALKWIYAVCDGEVQMPMSIISAAVLPSDDEVESEETLVPANVMVNEIPATEHETMLRNSVTRPADNGLVLDLRYTKGSSQEVSIALKRFLSKLNLSNRKSVQLEIIPPAGAKKTFIDTLMNNVKKIVPELAGTKDLSFRIQTKKTSNGVLSNISLQILIGSHEKTKHAIFPGVVQVPNLIPNIFNTVNLDLSNTNVNVNEEITNTLKLLLDQATPLLIDRKPVEMKLRVIPPPNSNTDWERMLVQKTTLILDGLIPSSVRSVVHGEAIDGPNGLMKFVDLDIILNPNVIPSQSTKIDLTKPGINIFKVLQTEIYKIIKSLPPEEFDQNIELQLKLPQGISPQLVNSIKAAIKSLVLVLKPDQRITIHTHLSKTPDSCNDLNVAINIGKSKPNTFNINLLGQTTLNEQVEKIISYLKTSTNKINKPETYTINITPPKNVANAFVKVSLNKIMDQMKTAFPNDKVEAKTITDTQGRIVNIIVTTTITAKSKPGASNVFTIDLSSNNINMIETIQELLPKIKLLQKQNNGIAEFTLSVQPPPSTSNTFVKNKMNEIFNALSELLPENKVNIMTRTKRLHDGTISNIDYVISVKPAEENTQSLTNIDLRNPEVNLNEVLIKLLPEFRGNINKNRNIQNEPVTFNMKVLPPKGANDHFVKESSATILKYFSKEFPNKKFKINTRTTKDSMGQVIDVSFTITVEPINSLENPQALTLNIKSNDTLQNGIDTIAPELIRNVDTGKPVEMSINIEPPNGFSPKDRIDTLKLAHATLSQILPNNQIRIRSETTKNKQGGISNLHLSVTINPIPKNPVIDFDLDDSKSAILEKITEVMPNLIAETLEPVSFTLEIHSLNGATDQIIKQKSDEIIEALSQISPHEKISINPKITKDSQGKIIDVKFVVSIEPTSVSSTTNQTKIEIITLNLNKPGANLTQEIANKLPSILNLANNKVSTEPIEFNFDIQPPSNSGDEFEKTTEESLSTVFSQIFPTKRIKTQVKTIKNNNGTISNMKVSVVIEPDSFSVNEIPTSTMTNPETVVKVTSPKPSIEHKVVEINLSKPGNTLESQIAELIPRRLPYLVNDLTNGKPISLTFNIEPPPESSMSFLSTNAQKIIPILSKYFPINQMSVKASAKKNSKGFLSNAVFTVDIQPSKIAIPHNHLVHETTPDVLRKVSTTENIDIDLMNPEETLASQIQKIMPGISISAKEKLAENKPITLNLHINPPEGSTDKFLQSTAQSIVPLLSKYFPLNQIGVKANAKKNSKGFLSDIILSIDIQPNEITIPTSDIYESENTTPEVSLNAKVIEEQTTPSVPSKVETTENQVVNIPYVTEQPNSILLEDDVSIEPSPQNETTVKIDLTQPGNDFEQQIHDIMPNIMTTLNDELGEGKPTTLTLNINPPSGSKDSYLQTLTQSMVPTISRFFPNNRVNVKANAKKDSEGNLSDVVLMVTIEPNAQEEITTERVTSQNQVKEIMPKLVVTEQTTELQVEKTNRVDIDLSKPDSNLIEQTDKILPEVVAETKEYLRNNKPVTLSFNIRPPNKATPQFLQTTTNSLVPILTKYFPTSKMNVETSAKKNPQGYISDIVVNITVDPPSEPETTTPVKEVSNNVDIDLSKPGITLSSQIEKILPNVVQNVKKNIDAGESTTLTFNITPPTGSRDSYLQTLTQSMVSSISSFFPNNQVNIKANAKKDSKDNLSDVVLIVTVEPNTQEEITTEKVTSPSPIEEIMPELIETETTTKLSQGETNRVDIDLSKPGSTLIEQTDKILPEVVTETKEYLRNNKPVTLSFNIRPPNKATPQFLQTTTNSLIPILTKYFPTSKMNVETSAQKNLQGYISDIIVNITVDPPSEPETTTSVKEVSNNVDIDLSKPGVTLSSQVEKLLPNVVQNVKKDIDAGESTTLTFNIKPPTGSRDSYLQTLTQSMVPSISSFFPNNRVNIKANAKKDSKGNLSDVILIVTIEPNAEEEIITEKVTSLGQIEEKMPKLIVTETTTKLPQGETNTVDIDLSKPGSTLIEQTDKILPEVVTETKEYLKNNKPVTLSFNIRPPNKATPQFLQTTTNSLVPILTKYFPTNKMNVETSAKKNSQGYISDVVVNITVDPSSEPETKIATQINNVDIDLSQRGTTLSSQIDKISPNVVQNVKKNLDMGEPTTLTFNIKPPMGSRESYLQTLTQSMIPSISSYFPDNQVNVRATATKDSKGNLSDVMLIVTVEPNAQPETTTEKASSINKLEEIMPKLVNTDTTTKSSQVKIEKVDIDLSKPGASLTQQVNKLLPHVVIQTKEDLKDREPVTISFKIRPPSQATSKFLEETTGSLAPILTNYFPGNKMNVETRAKKNSQGYISDVVVNITIEPSDEPVTTSVESMENEIDIDLSNPSSTLSEQVEYVMPRIVQNVENDLSNNKPTSLVLNIKPPKGSTESYVQTVAQSLIPLMSEKFPNNEINVKASMKKDSEGKLTDIVLEVIVEPRTPLPKTENIDIDLTKPGSNLVTQVNQILPTIIKQTGRDLSENKPITLSFRIHPPNKSTSTFLKTSSESLVPLLTNYFPRNEMNVESSAKKDDQGYITDVVLNITIEPPTKDSQELGSEQVINQASVDLSKPGSSLSSQIDKVLPDLIVNVGNDLKSDKPVDLTLNVKPPRGATQDYIQTVSQYLKPIISKSFPNNNVELKANAVKNSKGHLTDIMFTMTVYPADNSRNVMERPNERKIDIDLTRPGATLEGSLNEVLPNLVPSVKADLDENSKMNLQFNILPPPQATDQFLQSAVNSIVPTLTKYFPRYKTNVKADAKKNAANYLTDIILTVSIENPSFRKQQSSYIKFDLDLSKRRSNLNTQMKNVLPDIIEDVQENVSTGKPTVFNFRVKPPKFVSRQFVQRTIDDVSAILSQEFPSNKMHVSSSTKNGAKGRLEYLNIIVIIYA